MRDGVSSITNRYRKVKNKYIKSYDRKQELKHIIYLNANNLYSYVVSLRNKITLALNKPSCIGMGIYYTEGKYGNNPAL